MLLQFEDSLTLVFVSTTIVSPGLKRFVIMPSLEFHTKTGFLALRKKHGVSAVISYVDFAFVINSARLAYLLMLNTVTVVAVPCLIFKRIQLVSTLRIIKGREIEQMNIYMHVCVCGQKLINVNLKCPLSLFQNINNDNDKSILQCIHTCQHSHKRMYNK